MTVKHSELVGSKHSPRNSANFRVKFTLLMFLGLSILQSVGCTAWTSVNNYWRYNPYWNESMLAYRNRSAASKAWHCRKHHFANQRCLKEFAEGFKAGYSNVADGGNGCTPAFPPRDYWGWRYQSCEGQARVAAWFAGFPHGARAAEEEGIGHWTQMQTSANIQNQYVQNGLLNSTHNGVYPIPSSAIPNGMPVIEQGAVPMADPNASYDGPTGPIEISSIPTLIHQ